MDNAGWTESELDAMTADERKKIFHDSISLTLDDTSTEMLKRARAALRGD